MLNFFCGVVWVIKLFYGINISILFYKLGYIIVLVLDEEILKSK